MLPAQNSPPNATHIKVCASALTAQRYVLHGHLKGRDLPEELYCDVRPHVIISQFEGSEAAAPTNVLCDALETCVAKLALVQIQFLPVFGSKYT